MSDIKRARENMLRYRELNARLGGMHARRRTLEDRERALREELSRERQDVEKLEGRSLTAFFYTFTGQMEERLRKEKREAAEAALRYEMARSELDSLLADIAEAEAERGRLSGSEAEYARLIERKAEELKASDPVKGPQLLKTEQELAACAGRKREISEAVAAGKSALSCADMVMKSLDSAEGFGMWDMVGGGLIADIAKHSHLDDAQYMLQELQTRLSRFRTELSDVELSAELQVNVDGFLRFADYFFDGLFADWAVMSRIRSSIDSVQDCRQKLQQTLYHLQNMERDTENRLALLKNERDRIINS